MSVDFKTPVGQLKTEIQHRSWRLRLGRENIHSAFAQVKKDTLDFTSVGQSEFHRSLHRDAVSAAAFAI